MQRVRVFEIGLVALAAASVLVVAQVAAVTASHVQALRGRIRPVAALLAAAVSAALLAGCGIGAVPGTRSASVLVTANFGSTIYGTAVQQHVPGSETVMALLERHFKITTRHGGDIVKSINGHSRSSAHRAWFFFVNGIEAPKGAATTDVYAGDHIWWDLQDSSAAASVPAVVGSYPEPFTNGIGGKEFPTLLDCGTGVQAACNTVGKSLNANGVKTADQLLGVASGAQSLAVVVAPWSQVTQVIAAQLIAGGPRQSGVYAQFVGSRGQVLELDNVNGQVVRTLRGNIGLIAATGQPSNGQPTWFVTGSDKAGVMAAARAFTVSKLRDHFAVAVSGTKVIPVPLAAGV